jgi:hypothetical protein
VSDKKIKYAYDFQIAGDGESLLLKQLSGPGEAGEATRFTPQQTGEDDPIGMKLYTLMSYLTGQMSDTDERERRQAEIWQFYLDMGLAYDYVHGLNLKREIPVLNSLQEAYIKHLEKDVRGELKKKGKNLEKLIEAEKADDADGGKLAKVVYISFDPKLWPEARDAEGELILSESERHTLILVADDDQEKSSSELDAEREDLHLLVQMIIRQRLRDRKREEEAVRAKMEVIDGAVSQFVHRLQGERDIPEETKAEVSQLFKGLKPVISLQSTALEPREFGANSTEIMAGLLLGLAGPASSCADEEVQEALQKRMEGILSDSDAEASKPLVRYLPSTLPGLTLRAPTTVIRESFDVMFKNAVEAASQAGDTVTGLSPQVSVQVQARPRDPGNPHSSEWFIDVVVENSTEPVSRSLLDKLNCETPALLEKNPKKRQGSLGMGVFSSRTQLKQGVGRGADIQFLLVAPHQLQARMSLPATARFERPVAGAAAAAEPAQTLRQYILYIEDVEKIAGPSVEYLESALAGSGVQVIWKRSFEAGAAVLESSLPVLLIADMGILQNDSQQEAENKWGEMLLDLFLEQASADGCSPPVWLVTGRSRTEVEQDISNLSSFQRSGYAFAAPDMNDMIVGGLIHILDKTDLAKHERVREGVLKLVESRVEATIASSEKGPAPGAPKEQYSVVEASFTARDFDQQLARYFEKHSQGFAGCHQFIGHGRGAEIGQLAALVRRWLLHPGVPDLEYPRAPVSLRDTTYHKTIALVIAASSSIMAKIRPSTLYWCIRNNIVIRNDGDRRDGFHREWSRIVKDRKGLLSVIRHDLKMIGAQAMVDERLIRDLSGAVDSCDALLTEPEEAELLERLAHASEAEFCESFAKVLVPAAVAEQSRSQVKQSIESIMNGLSKLKEGLPEYRSKIEILIDALDQTGKWLEVST